MVSQQLQPQHTPPGLGYTAQAQIFRQHPEQPAHSLGEAGLQHRTSLHDCLRDMSWFRHCQGLAHRPLTHQLQESVAAPLVYCLTRQHQGVL